jgi:hypothetical protein
MDGVESSRTITDVSPRAHDGLHFDRRGRMSNSRWRRDRGGWACSGRAAPKSVAWRATDWAALALRRRVKKAPREQGLGGGAIRARLGWGAKSSAPYIANATATRAALFPASGSRRTERPNRTRTSLAGICRLRLQVVGQQAARSEAEGWRECRMRPSQSCDRCLRQGRRIKIGVFSGQPRDGLTLFFVTPDPKDFCRLDQRSAHC